MNQQRNVLVEKLPDKLGHFQYLNSTLIKPTAVEAMAEEREVRLGWLTHPQIGISSGQSMIDVGARYGEYTLTALALGADHVYAFEKNKELVKVIRENLHLNEKSFIERCSVLNRTISPITSSIDSYVFDECSAVPRNIKWIVIDVGGQDELNIVNGCIKTVENYRPLNVLIHHYDKEGPRNFSEQFLAANSFDCKMVVIKHGDEFISTTSIY